MKAVVFESFGGKLNIQDINKPMPKSHGVVIRVKATGVCRSDWPLQRFLALVSGRR